MTKINDHIDMLEVPLVAETPVRVTLVNGSDFAVLIDTGTSAMAPAILELIQENAGTLDRVRLIINTHAHHDHIGANHQVKQACGALLAAPRETIGWIEDFDTHYGEFCLVAPDVLPDQAWMREECLSIMDEPTHVDMSFGEGDLVRLGGEVELEVLALPGHLKAEIGFIERATNTLIIGDAVINNTITDLGPMFHGYQRAAAYKRTLGRLRALVTERRFSRIVSAHLPIADSAEFIEFVDRAQTFVATVESNLLAIVDEKEDASLAQIWDALCAKWGYRKEFRGLAMVMTHLDLLVASKSVARSETGTYRIA
jgi:glyoxylase-like metal-dependent hydrolase (beta-lactamase superfamily II)